MTMSPKKILDSISEGLYVTDRDRRIVYWSRGAERITGWSSAEATGKRCSDNFLCHADKEGRLLCGAEFCPLHRAMTTGQSSTFPLIVFASTRNGKIIPMRASVAPIRNNLGEIVGGVETFQDISLEYDDIQKIRQIQSNSLVNEAAGDPRLSVAIHFAPHDIVGGDFFAINRVGQNRYAFFLADVAGHGIAPALYTMYLNSLWEEYRHRIATPKGLVQKINGRLNRLIHGGSTFATALCGILDLTKGTFSVASAGGPPPVVYRSSGDYETPRLAGMPLGCFEKGEFDVATLKAGAGDHILLFTDGVVDISNEDGVMLNVKQLVSIFQQCNWPGSGADFKEIEPCLLAYSNRIRFKDDLTLLDIGIKQVGTEETGK